MSQLTVNVPADQLAAALNVVVRAISRSPLPVLAHVLMTARDGKLHLTGTDLELAISTSLDATVLTDGVVCPHARTLLDVVKSLQKGSGVVSLQQENDSRTVLTCGKSRFAINAFPESEYPAVPKETSDAKFTVDGPTFRAALKRVAIAMAEDQSRMILMGVCVEWDGATLALAATDTHRLAEMKITEGVSGPTEALRFIIPARVVIEAMRLTGDSMTIQKTANLVDIADETTTISGREIFGEFPPYQRVIPQDAAKKWTCSVADLKAALNRTEIAARVESHKVIMQVSDDNTLTLTSQSTDVGEATEHLDIAMASEMAEPMAFNAQYLLDGLGVADTESVTFHASKPLAPSLWRYSGDDNYLYVVMPMQILA